MRTPILLLALAASAPAHADDEPIPGKALTLAKSGRAAHDSGDYPRAIAAFKEAYVIAPSPALLFNLAQAYRLQGNCDDASMMYRRYLASGPSAEGRVLAETHLATVERCVRKRALNIPLDDSMAYLSVPRPPTDLGVVDTPAPSRRSLKRDLGIGFTIAGTAALGLATYYGFRAHQASEDVERAYAMGAKWKDVEDRHADGQRSASAARIFAVGGGVALVTGVSLFFLGRQAPVPMSITPTSGGARASLSWDF